MDHRADVRGLLSNGQDLGTGNGEPMPSASPDLLMRTMEGRLTFWPAGMEQRYGFTSEQALGHVSHQLLKTIYPRALNEIEETLLRQSNWSGGLIHRHADGRRSWSSAIGIFIVTTACTTLSYRRSIQMRSANNLAT